jgi:hypothetical protein
MQKLGLNLVVQHHEISPFSRTKHSFGLKHLVQFRMKRDSGLIYQALTLACQVLLKTSPFGVLVPLPVRNR